MISTVRKKQTRDPTQACSEVVLPVLLGDAPIGVLHCRPLEAGADEDLLFARLEEIGRALFRHAAARGKTVREVELATNDPELPSWRCRLETAPATSDRVPRQSVVRDLLGRPRRPDEADLQKDELVAMLGHELRNPLAAIRNATELLGMLDHAHPELARIHGVLDRQTRQTAKLIDGLLDASRILRGKLTLDHAVVDLAALLRDLVADHRPHCDRLGLSLTLEAPKDPLWVEGDGVRLVQIFDNLLANAARFTRPGGHVEVTARGGDCARVCVSDDGEGIDPGLLPRIFEPFCQGSQTIDRSIGGLGLGLTLVRGLVELHGGAVIAESPGPGRGSAFTVELDLASRPGRARSLPPPRGLALRVLVVEDNQDMAEMLADLLAAGGHEVDIASSGCEGIARIRLLLPDVVLCDLGLPGEVDGFAVAEAIRTDARLRDIGLVALTGFGGPEHRSRAAEVGFDACLVKPVTLDVLERHLARCARPSRPPEA